MVKCSLKNSQISMLGLVKKLVWLVAFLVTILVALPLFVGWYLSPQDVLERSDAIVVVSGGDNNSRIEKAVELQRDGWAPYILFSGAAAEGSVSNALAMKRIAVKKGVPSEKIFIEEESRTTSENAELAAPIIKEKGFKSIILVTSPYHQRRTFELFKAELPEVKILNRSAMDENWRKKGWWENTSARYLTVGELGKILVNYIQEFRDEGR
jgi:uncharacterized SAM-binding protein YcdF (DUF218 family)